MKTLQVFAIFLVFIIQAVLSVPKWYTAKDGTQFLIETEYEYNWYQAWHECARQNAQLVVIDTHEKNNIIEHLLTDKFIPTYNLWIGANDAYGDRQDKMRPFYWSATGEELSFTNWADNQPDNNRYKEHCVHILRDSLPSYGWNDNSCHNAELGYICEEKSPQINKETNNKLIEKSNEKDVTEETEESVKPKVPVVKQQYSDEKDIVQETEEEDIVQQTAEKIHPKLLAGQTKPTENSIAIDGTNIPLNTILVNNRKWKDIIKSSLRKTELDIFGSLFSLERDVDKVAEGEK